MKLYINNENQSIYKYLSAYLIYTQQYLIPVLKSPTEMKAILSLDLVSNALAKEGPLTAGCLILSLAWDSANQKFAQDFSMISTSNFAQNILFGKKLRPFKNAQKMSKK